MCRYIPIDLYDTVSDLIRIKCFTFITLSISMHLVQKRQLGIFSFVSGDVMVSFARDDVVTNTLSTSNVSYNLLTIF